MSLLPCRSEDVLIHDTRRGGGKDRKEKDRKL